MGWLGLGPINEKNSSFNQTFRLWLESYQWYLFLKYENSYKLSLMEKLNYVIKLRDTYDAQLYSVVV